MTAFKRARSVPVEVAVAFKPLGEEVLFLEVVVGRGLTLSGRMRPLRLPVEAALDHPAQDAGPFGLELLLELRVGFAGLRLNGTMLNRRRMASSTFRSAGCVVADDGQLELRAGN